MEQLVKKRNLIAICISCLIILILVFWYLFYYPLPWGINKNDTFVIVEKGDNLRKISQKLKGSGVEVNSPALFLSSKIMGIDRKIIPGRYDFQRGITLSGLLRKFYKNEVSGIEVTIPEGYNLNQIASLLKREIGLDSVLFVKTASDTSLIHRLGLDSKNLEGFLFPDTYRLFWKMNPEKIIEL
ncbi:MAG TPA: endolytic transglycosylase MltG, partial [Terriglobales bacterium]|nr:endolytic transglycosylase MltG [Terriglobales bacterium]